MNTGVGVTHRASKGEGLCCVAPKERVKPSKEALPKSHKVVLKQFCTHTQKTESIPHPPV